MFSELKVKINCEGEDLSEIIKTRLVKVVRDGVFDHLQARYCPVKRKTSGGWLHLVPACQSNEDQVTVLPFFKSSTLLNQKNILESGQKVFLNELNYLIPVVLSDSAVTVQLRPEGEFRYLVTVVTDKTVVCKLYIKICPTLKELALCQVAQLIISQNRNNTYNHWGWSFQSESELSWISLIKQLKLPRQLQSDLVRLIIASNKPCKSDCPEVMRLSDQ